MLYFCVMYSLWKYFWSVYSCEFFIWCVDIGECCFYFFNNGYCLLIYDLFLG